MQVRPARGSVGRGSMVMAGRLRAIPIAAGDQPPLGRRSSRIPSRMLGT